jgi:glycosyltransferase involved in cell wall biosynthesis
MTAPRVSVVTPVHNGERHLAECIESVLGQSFDQWEYTIVDNCSDDGTLEIAERYAAVDSRIRYERHNDYVGVIESHNRAFETMDPRSTYCKVLGSDDWLYPECLERMVALADASPDVGVVSAYCLAGATVDLVGLPYWKTTVTGIEILRQSLMGGPYVTGSPTSVLIRSGLVRARQPFYDSSFRHADTEAAYWALTRSNFGLVHQVLTYTRLPGDGETSTSERLGSYAPENLRMLLRYGPDALDKTEYRGRLRHELDRYVKWHIKQTLKPSRRRDASFQAYHRNASELIAAEASDDAEVQRRMKVVRAVLRHSYTRRAPLALAQDARAADRPPEELAVDLPSCYQMLDLPQPGIAAGAKTDFVQTNE